MNPDNVSWRTVFATVTVIAVILFVVFMPQVTGFLGGLLDCAMIGLCR